VALVASTEMLGVLEAIGSHLKNPHVDPPVPEPPSNHDRPGVKRATKLFTVARGKVPGIYPAWDGRTLQDIQEARRCRKVVGG
jgi:hypothetical protein